MKKVFYILPLLLLSIGCTTPQSVYDDMNLIKDNIVIQKRVADMLLKNVKAQNDKQIEVLAAKVMETEQRFDRMAATHNRLVIYFKAEQKVGYIVNIINFMQESNLKNLLGQAEGNVRHGALCSETIVLDYDNLVYNNRWLSGTPEGQ